MLEAFARPSREVSTADLLESGKTALWPNALIVSLDALELKGIKQGGTLAMNSKDVGSGNL